jgi:polysaccharide pyruvyl transferase WcaK-like protein
MICFSSYIDFYYPKAPAQIMLKIGLLFHSAKNDNLGVGALTVSEVEIIRRISRSRGLEVHITELDGRAMRPACVTGPDVTVLELRLKRKPWEVFRVLRGCDVLIDIGAGDSFTDIYGGKRFFLMHLQKYMTHFAGRPLVLAPQTIGPFKSRLRQAIATRSIMWSKIVSTRDSMSTRAVREMGIRSEVIEASDVALRLPYTPPPRAPGGPNRVGLNVSGLLMNGGYTRDNMFGLKMDYPQLVRDIITHFVNRPEPCEVHLVPHVISWTPGTIEDDYQVSLDLAAEFPGVTVAPAFTTPSEAKSYIAGLDFFMGARMHACIAAFSSGVPVVPMAYSRKFAGLFGSLGYDHTVDCTAESGEIILQRIFAAYEDRHTLAEETKTALARGLEKLSLYEMALGDLLERIAAEKR